MYASDVHLSGMYWLSAIIGKMLSTALSEVLDSGALDEAYHATKMILSEIAKKLYRFVSG